MDLLRKTVISVGALATAAALLSLASTKTARAYTGRTGHHLEPGNPSGRRRGGAPLRVAPLRKLKSWVLRVLTEFGKSREALRASFSILQEPLFRAVRPYR